MGIGIGLGGSGVMLGVRFVPSGLTGVGIIGVPPPTNWLVGLLPPRLANAARPEPRYISASVSPALSPGAYTAEAPATLIIRANTGDDAIVSAMPAI